ncbi:MAG: His/Gly/Thr/Pro-type tRNA ligase C-terminal domain-containing protein, partial [Pyrinomonadaceae bacterium]
AHEVKREISKADFICDIDETSESVNKKIRNAQLLQINYMLTVGDKEVENKTVTLRTRDNVVHGEIKLSAFLSALHHEKETKSLISSFKEGTHAHNHG